MIIVNVIGSKGAEYIGNALKINNTLVNIVLFGILKNKYFIIIRLIWFCFEGVGIIGRGVTEIANALKINKTLKQINLSGNIFFFFLLFFRH